MPGSFRFWSIKMKSHTRGTTLSNFFVFLRPYFILTLNNGVLN